MDATAAVAEDAFTACSPTRLPGREHVAAASAASYAAQQVWFFPARCGSHRRQVGGMPLGRGHDRRVRVAVQALAAVGLAHIDAILDDALDHRRRPAASARARGALVEAAGNLGARSVRGAHLKRLADRGRQWPRKQPLVLALDIPDWRELRDVDAAPDRARRRSLPGLADAVALELGEHEQNAKEGLAYGCREIDVVGDAHEHGAL